MIAITQHPYWLMDDESHNNADHQTSILIGDDKNPPKRWLNKNGILLSKNKKANNILYLYIINNFYDFYDFYING